MSTREAKAYARLREHVCRPEDRFERVENGLVDGMPDVNYCLAGCEGWIEIKCPALPARDTTPLLGGGDNHPLSVGQANWMLKQSRARGRAWLFIVTREWCALIPGAVVGKLGADVVNALTAADILAQAAWKVQLPVRDATAWFDLREKLTDAG